MKIEDKVKLLEPATNNQGNYHIGEEGKIIRTKVPYSASVELVEVRFGKRELIVNVDKLKLIEEE